MTSLFYTKVSLLRRKRLLQLDGMPHTEKICIRDYPESMFKLAHN